MKYFKLKDQKSSGGATVDGIFYNNSTVVAYEYVPAIVNTNVRAGVLTEATEAEYNKYLEEQNLAAENRAKRFAQKQIDKKNKETVNKFMKAGRIGEIVIVEPELKREEKAAETENTEGKTEVENGEGGKAESEENAEGEGGEGKETETATTKKGSKKKEG